MSLGFHVTFGMCTHYLVKMEKWRFDIS